jgi:RNA polymerase sigma-70 factor (ECF subfamily)
MIDRVIAGDDTALAAIYDRYSALVFGVATRLVDRSAAADVAQEVFVQLWQRPSGFDPARGALRTYLAVMARRRAVDALRRSGRARAREQRASTANGRTLPGSPETDEAALASVDAGKVRRAVADLPKDQRRAVELAYFGGMTFRQVAVELDIAEGTAKSRLRLAMTKLARTLAEMGDRS